jgi:hypothetical protein
MMADDLAYLGELRDLNERAWAGESGNYFPVQ